MAVAYNPSTVTSGLITAIDFGNIKSSPGSGGSGTTIWDISGNGNNWSTCDATTLTTTKASLDGNNGKIESVMTPNLLAWTQNASVGNGAMTIEAAFKSSDTAGHLVSKPWNGSGQYNYKLTPLSFSIEVGGASEVSATINFPANLCDGVAKHIVVWMDGTNFGFYINGNAYIGSGAHGITGGAGLLGNPALAGVLGSLYPYGTGWAGNTAQALACEIYTARFYSRVLTSAEVMKNFNAVRGRFGL